jgi:hypothetical protein
VAITLSDVHQSANATLPNVALRSSDLRYCSASEAASVGAVRMGMHADLLGITSWRTVEPVWQPLPSAR